MQSWKVFLNKLKDALVQTWPNSLGPIKKLPNIPFKYHKPETVRNFPTNEPEYQVTFTPLPPPKGPRFGQVGSDVKNNILRIILNQVFINDDNDGDF